MAFSHRNLPHTALIFSLPILLRAHQFSFRASSHLHTYCFFFWLRLDATPTRLPVTYHRRHQLYPLSILLGIGVYFFFLADNRQNILLCPLSFRPFGAAHRPCTVHKFPSPGIWPQYERHILSLYPLYLTRPTCRQTSKRFLMSAGICHYVLSL